MPRRIRYDAWSATDGGLVRRGGMTTWTSPWRLAGFAFTDLVASWHARTTGGSWIEVAVQARGSRRWHTLAHWQGGRRATRRTSVEDDPEVDTDIWSPRGGADAYRLRVGLHPSTSGRLPTLERIGAVVSAGPVRTTTSSPLGRTARILDVPRLSQMTHADIGGGGWCSPTSVAMVLAHAGTLPPAADGRPADVPAAAREVLDPAYGAGNWSFNTAWAASRSGNAFVTRLRDLRDAERLVAAGVPVVASIAYAPGALRGAPTHGTPGHLVVIRGFTGCGDVVANDPGAPSDRSVRRTYDRGRFERAWLRGSGGLVYVIHRDDQVLPRAPWTGAAR